MIRPAESFWGFLKTQPAELRGWVNDFWEMMSFTCCLAWFEFCLLRLSVTERIIHSGWFWNSEWS